MTAAIFARAEKLSPKSEQALHARYVELEAALRQSPFGRPMILESVESPERLLGEVYAVIDHPFAAVDAQLKKSQNWCDVLILHLNIKFCQTAGGDTSTSSDLIVHIGSKREQALEDSYRLQFDFDETTANADYFQIRLHAAEGPLSTSNFRIMLEAAPLGGDKTFLHFTYAYDYGFAGRVAMKAYLATIGRDKVGFTAVAKAGDDVGYVDGVRALTERNTMRYYLAIDAYIRASAQPDAFEKSLNYWFSATEQFPRQLHEIERSAYLAMKRGEYARQNAMR